MSWGCLAHYVDVPIILGTSIDAFMPSSFGMFVYRLLTSIVRRMILAGSLSFSEKIRRRKFVESLTYDLMWIISGFRK